jgi:hypothetical protein
MLDGKMREIRKTGRVIGTDRIAVMAALNIAHELFQLQKTRAVDRASSTRGSHSCRSEWHKPWPPNRRWTRRAKGYSLWTRHPLQCPTVAWVFS